MEEWTSVGQKSRFSFSWKYRTGLQEGNCGSGHAVWTIVGKQQAQIASASEVPTSPWPLSSPQTHSRPSQHCDICVPTPFDTNPISSRLLPPPQPNELLKTVPHLSEVGLTQDHWVWPLLPAFDFPVCMAPIFVAFVPWFASIVKYVSELSTLHKPVAVAQWTFVEHLWWNKRFVCRADGRGWGLERPSSTPSLPWKALLRLLPVASGSQHVALILVAKI